MLTIDSFEHPDDFPRLTYLETQLPRVGSEKARLAILAALLAYPNTEPKTTDTIAELTQYSANRLHASLPRLLDDSAFVRCVLVNHQRAYLIMMDGAFHGEPHDAQSYMEKNTDADVLKLVIQDVRRRALCRRRTTVPAYVPREITGNNLHDDAEPVIAVTTTHDAPDDPDDHDRSTPRVAVETLWRDNSPDEPDSIVAGSQSAEDIEQLTSAETQEVAKKFADIVNRYRAAVSTKHQFEQFGNSVAEDQPGLPLVTLKREVLSEAYDTLQTMMLETGQHIADTLDATVCTISAPCSICFDTMRNPHVFNGCGHAYCQTCCETINWMRVNPITMGKECPMCRRISAPIPLYL